MMNMVNPLLVKFSLKSAKYSFSNKYIVCFELAKSTFNLKWWNYTAEPEIELIVRGGEETQIVLTQQLSLLSFATSCKCLHFSKHFWLKACAAVITQCFFLRTQQL